MGFRIVILSVFPGGAGRVEVAKRRVFEPVDPAVPVENLLKAEFGFTVRIDRMLGGVFLDRNFLRFPEGGRRAGEHKGFDAAFHGRVRKVDCVGKVVVEVFARILHGFADQGEGGKVHDGVVFPVFDDLDQVVAVAQIGFDEFGSRVDGLDMSGDQIIENGDFIASVQQVFGAGAADITRSSGHKNTHGSASCFSVRSELTMYHGKWISANSKEKIFPGFFCRGESFLFFPLQQGESCSPPSARMHCPEM